MLSSILNLLSKIIRGPTVDLLHTSHVSFSHLQLADKTLLDSILGGCIGGDSETLSRLPELLLLLLTVRISCCSLTADRAWSAILKQ